LASNWCNAYLYMDGIMNNEPVAWLWIHKGNVMNALLRNPDCDERNKEYWSNKGWHSEPLYTHPAKTLTDEEILDICIMGGFYDRIDDPFFDKKTGAWTLDEDLIQFARAILRKAQDK